ncbi:MAG: MucR family transcriptional regulator, partial [Gammaproteobacteria bacterium]|nr:MucR family transcriptional regulator [Gammaproteobacteria bacterium]
MELQPADIQALHDAASRAEFTERDPHVPIKESVTDDYIVCLEDGCKVTDLTRHLRTAHDMTPAQYRAKWYLPISYPMT